MIPIAVLRCFPGWEAIKDRYVTPGNDGDIFLWVDAEAWADARDAELIIQYLQREPDDE
jgi:hypothetical protein